MSKKRKTLLRYAIGLVSIAGIVFLWVKNDIAEIYSTVPSAQIAPLILTCMTVSVLKVLAVAGIIFLFRRISGKIKRRR